MEHILELLYEGTAVFIFCMAAALLLYGSGCMNRQHDYVKSNIYEQHMFLGAEMD